MRKVSSESSPTPRVVLTVEEAAAELSIGRTRMFALVKTGEVDSVLIGRLRRVPASALVEYVERLRRQPTSTR